MTIGNSETLVVADQFLDPGFFCGFRFQEGWLFINILGREWTNVLQFWNSGAKISVATDVGFSTPVDSSSRNLLEPATTNVVHQIFTGIAPSNARLFTNFPSGRVIQTLRGSRAVTGNVGFYTGQDSHFENPDTRTELWCFKDMNPDFDPFLPAYTRFAQYVKTNHIVVRYTYGVVQDAALIKQFIRRDRRAKLVTMGSPDALANRPSFLDQYSNLFDLSVAEEANAYGQVPSRPA